LLLSNVRVWFDHESKFFFCILVVVSIFNQK
jgi:hypothetical protein